MEHGARLSTSRVMAIAFIFMSVLIVLSLSVNVIQGVNNYRLQNEQRTAVTPMAFNAPFAVSQNSADASYLQQMALSFIALRLNVSSETVDASHQALLQYIRPGAQNQMKVILAEVLVGAVMYMMTKNVKFLAGFAIISVFIAVGMAVVGL